MEATVSAPSKSSELGQFREHIELYEFLVDNIKSRVQDSVMPAINQLKNDMANLEQQVRLDGLTRGLKPLSDCGGSGYSARPYRSEGSDVFSMVCYGIIMGALIYVAWKYSDSLF